MKLSLTLAILFSWGVAKLNAQDQYIVKLNGDTIRGKLQINPLRDNTTTMYFKHQDGSKENIRHIRASYAYYDEEFQFRSIPFNNQRLFMQIVKEDKNLSYYHYIHKRDNSIATTKILAKPNGEATELSALSFRKQVSEFLDDCPQIKVKIDAKLYKYKDIDQLFEDYNKCDIQVVLASSVEQNDPDVKPEAVTGTTSVAAVSTTQSSSSKVPENSKKQDKLNQVDAFRKYVRELDDFEHARDVLEWLTDVEYRVSQDREVPNYLWNSLNAMTGNNQDLQKQAAELKRVLEN